VVREKWCYILVTCQTARARDASASIVKRHRRARSGDLGQPVLIEMTGSIARRDAIQSMPISQWFARLVPPGSEAGHDGIECNCQAFRESMECIGKQQYRALSNVPRVASPSACTQRAGVLRSLRNDLSAIGAALCLSQSDHALINLECRIVVADSGALLDRVVDVLMRHRQVPHEIMERLLETLW
jgi:hypothetical protein